MEKNNHSGNGHIWRFFRAGGFDQVRLDAADDLLSLENLDQKLWVALACPIDNVHFDARTLGFIDTDGDRRVRPAELIAAIKWSASLLNNPGDLTDGKTDFALPAVSGASDEGKLLIATMRRALDALGKNETDTVTIAELESLETILSRKPFNGDGIITSDAAPDDAIRTIIGEIITALGPVTDRSGEPGINAEKVETFFTQAQAYESWYSESQRDPAVRPLGEATGEAVQAFVAVREKIDDYFTRCAIAGFDEKAISYMNGVENRYEAMTGKQLSVLSQEIADLPLARIAPQCPLPLYNDLNPAWEGRIKKFVQAVVRPLVGPTDTLSLIEWQGLLSSFAPWFAWAERRPVTVFDTFGAERVLELNKSAARKMLIDLIEKDKAEAATFSSLVSLEKLARFRRDVYPLCLNFVNFKDFYSRSGAAIFQAGTLYLDQRSCNFCLKVDDPNKHAVMAAMAGTYLAYCECRGRGGAIMTIVAAFTNGDSENIIVGRNGVFYDREGNDWDATVTRIIENPISLRQAFWLPYKSLVRMIESQVAKRATAANAQSTSKLEQTATTVSDVGANKPDPPPKNLDIGIVAALGVAAGALGTFIATLLGYASGIFKLGPIAVIAALAGLLLLISGPSIILAYIKLRKRNLGPILDASGWAVNAKARINVPFGTVLTHIAVLPPGAQRDRTDPYAEKKSPWPKVIVLALLVYCAYFALDHLGFVNEWTRGRIGLKKENRENAVHIDKKISPTATDIKDR